MFIFRKNGHFYEKVGKKGEPVCIDDEIPFDIPDNWEWVYLENILNIVSARRVHQSDWKKEGIPFYRAREIGKLAEFGFVDNELFISDELFEEFKEYGMPQVNDLMVTGVGTLGKTYIVKEDDKFYYKDASVLCFKNFAGLNPYFLRYLMQSIFMKNQIKLASSGTTVATITMKKANLYKIPLPPLDEQKRIVDKIEEVIPLIVEFNKNEDSLTKLNSEFPDKLKSSILQEAIQGKIVPQNLNDEPASVLLEKIMEEKERLIKEKKIKRNKNESYIFKENNLFYEKIGKNEQNCIDDEIPFDIPGSWEWCKLENIIELISGRDLKKTQYNVLKQGIPYVTGASNIIDGRLLINRWTDDPAVIAEKNDILLSCKGTIGKILILNEDKVHIARQIMSIRLIDETLINREYIVIFLMYYVTKLINIAKSMIPGISREDVLKINIPLPPLEEQKRIVEKIDLLFEQLNF